MWKLSTCVYSFGNVHMNLGVIRFVGFDIGVQGVVDGVGGGWSGKREVLGYL